MENNIDPYKMLGLKQDFEIEDLRSNFKKLVLKVHPDKNPNGSDEAFKIVAHCYKILLKEHKRKEKEKQYNELKNGFKDYKKTQEDVKLYNTEMKMNYDSQEKFGKHFNETFDKFRVKNAYDDGYANAMEAHNDIRAEINIDNKMGKYNRDKFNDEFDKSTVIPEKKIIKYEVPEALVSCKVLGYSELGVSNINDFSGENETLKKLNYTDYMKAYSTSRLVDPRSVSDRKEYRNIEDVEKDRSKVSFVMNDEDLEKNAKLERLNSQKEKRRLEHIAYEEKLYSDQFNHVNKAMLQYK
jgi:curved DNA-binding protein CbpA